MIHPNEPDGKRPALNGKISIKRKPRPMEKILKKTFAEHWVGIQNVQEVVGKSALASVSLHLTIVFTEPRNIPKMKEG